MAEFLVITGPGASLGFRCAGVETLEVEESADVSGLLLGIQAGGKYGLVAMEEGLLAKGSEVTMKRLRIKGELVTLQVYEDTSGISVGEEVISYGMPLSVTLGPGLLTGIFDGIQRPLTKIRETAGGVITRGVKVAALDIDKTWEFSPIRKKGDTVEPGDVIGTVNETERIVHRIMVPPGIG